MSTPPIRTTERPIRERLLALSKEERTRILSRLPNKDVATLEYDWLFWARPNQLPPPGDWSIWLIQTGRGFGKTRSAAMWIHQRAMAGNSRRWIALISRSPGDARDDMLDGPGGLLKSTPTAERPHYYQSSRRLTWPSGAYATIYSGYYPDQIRGFSGDTAWIDELASFQYPDLTWQNLLFGLREVSLSHPKVVVSTTPRPIKIIKDLHKWPGVVITTGTSYENRENLADIYYQIAIAPHEGSSLGRQEIHGEIVDRVDGALWDWETLDRCRCTTHACDRIVVAVDPPAGDSPGSAEAGIVVCGAEGRGPSAIGVVLADCSVRGSPAMWGRRVAEAYSDWRASSVIAEGNQGGEMVRYVIHSVNPDIPVRLVHAHIGKAARAEPISVLYTRGRIKHTGQYPVLEDQLRSWIPGTGPSPDRLDALVWGMTHLLLDGRKSAVGHSVASQMDQINSELMRE